MTRGPERRRAGPFGALAALLLAAACGADGPAPRWIHLAATPGAVAAARAAEGTWFAAELPREAFEPGLVAGFWSFPDPFADSDLPVDSEREPVLEIDGRELEFRDRLGLNAILTEVVDRVPESGVFFHYNQRLHVALPPDPEGGARELPERVTLRAFVEPDTVTSGRSRTRTRGVVADGFSVRSGDALDLHADLPADAALTFTAAALAPFGTDAAEETRLRVLVDGEEVFAHEATPRRRYEPERHRVVLPADAHAGARWRFEASGGEGLWVVGNPVVAPAEIGTPAERPWNEGGADERPSLVVFLADTLRADALGAYGSEADVTPHLDRFAASGATFLRAWAPSSWTLPSHASLFSGVFPYQHGASRKGVRLGTGLETMGERFSEAGYRTGAVTDGLFVSRRWGLDRGFERFEENDPGSLEATLAGVRAFLDADDGRPFLLFVQSYHAHGPYVLQEETLAEHGERLGITETWDELMQRITTLLREEGVLKEGGAGLDPDALFSLLQRTELNDTLREMTTQFHAVYRGRVLELDAAFGDLLAELESRDLRDETTLVFTSDHGEGFGEHGKLFHGSGVWDEILRIPLIVAGPDVEPGPRSVGASLIDVPPTLADVAGVDPAPTWLGTSLLDLDEDRPIFAFDCAQNTEELAAWIDGPHKAAVPVESPTGPLRYLYDLEDDPAERANLATDPPPEAVDERAALESALEALLLPLDAVSEAALSAEMLERLEAMGYADGEEDAGMDWRDVQSGDE